MSDGFAEVEAIQARLTACDRRRRSLKWVLLGTLILTAIAGATGYVTASGVLALITVSSGLGFVWTGSRYSTLQTELVEKCSHNARQGISEGRGAIRDGELATARSAFERSAELGEVGSEVMDQSPADWKKRANEDGLDEGLPLEYVVSTSYLSVLDSYENSAYELDKPRSQLDATNVALDSQEYAVASSQLTGIVELLDDTSPLVKGLQRSNEVTELEGIGPRRAEKLSTAGYDDLVRLANTTVDVLVEIPLIGSKTAESIQSTSRKVVSDAGFVPGLIGDKTTIEAYRNEWNELAIRLRDELVSESVHALEAELQDLPDPTAVSPEEADNISEQFAGIRTRVIEPLCPLATLQRSTADSSWVEPDFSAIEPDPQLPSVNTDQSNDPLAVALIHPETIQDEFDISQQKAEHARTRALDRISRFQEPFSSFEEPIAEFNGRLEQYDSIGRWYVPCEEAIKDIEDSIQRARNDINTDLQIAAQHLDEATEQVDDVESTLQQATFPQKTRSEFEERLDGLSEAICEVETSIEEQQHRETFEESQQLVEQATEQTVSEQFEAAESNLQTAEEKLSTVESTIEQSRVSSVEKRIERVRDDITAGSIAKELDEITLRVQRAQKSLGSDLNLADDYISQARSHLTTTQDEFEDSRLSGKQRDLPARIEELWKSIEEVEHQATVQEARQTLGEARDLINQADRQTKSGQLETATSHLQKAKSHIAIADPILERSEIAAVENKIEEAESNITVTSISNELDDIEDAVQDAEESLGTDLEPTTKQLSQASSALERVDERIHSELESSEHKQPLINRLDALRESVADAEHRIRIRKGEQSLAEAHNSLDAAQESIGTLELRAVPSMVKSARDRVKSITVTELEQEITAFHSEAASIRESLIETKVTYALDEAQHELNRARGYLQHDVDDTRSRLRAARNHLRAANILKNDDRLSPSVQEDFTEQIERYRSQVQTMVDRCQEQEITEAIDEAVAEIETVRGNFHSGAIEQARGQVESAVARIQNVPDKAPDAEVDKLRDDLNTIQTKIVRYEIGEYITNAEETVNRAEAERAAGEETAAIEAYQQAISTYKAAISDAQGASLPEAFEIERRIEQLTIEIDNTRDQWVERRSMQIDRELRAGERAVAQGLEATSEVNLEVAETKYDIAEEAAAGAREWLQETADNSTDSELSLPSTLAAEYRSATSGLTGHLGYLRTQINEATDSKTGGANSTPLAEYYDGLYAVYQAMPDTVHPLWQEALTTVLFGGDGLAENATEFGAQQSERNDTPISVLREEQGNGKLITEFNYIDTASPRSKDQIFAGENQQLPVAPESKTVLPIDVDSTAVLDAIELLAEFPAVPEADYEGEEATELLKIDYFENQFLDKQSVRSEERNNKDHSQKESVSNELATLQQELEAQISDS